jgi:hypothetical protein
MERCRRLLLQSGMTASPQSAAGFDRTIAQFAAQAWTVSKTRLGWMKSMTENPMPNPTSPSTSRQLWQALVRDQPAHVRKLLAQGTGANTARFTHKVPVNGTIIDWPGLTATALAVLVDCDALEDDWRIAMNDTREPKRRPSRRGIRMLPQFKPYADLSGIHGAGGKSLMHFAREPDVARWLIENGAPCEVTDDEGKMPGDVLPPEVAAIVDAHLLGAGLAASGKKTSAARARL